MSPSQSSRTKTHFSSQSSRVTHERFLSLSSDRRMRRYRNYKRKRQEKKGYHIRRTVYANDDEKNSLIRYPSNYVETTRYNILTFLPKNLWEQFHRVANVFFVFLMVLTLTPISPVIPGTFPPLFLVGDYRRCGASKLETLLHLQGSHPSWSYTLLPPLLSVLFLIS